MPDLAVATIVAKNYVSFARVLAQSFSRIIRMFLFSCFFRTRSTAISIRGPSRFVSCAKASLGFPISRASASAMTASRSPSPRSPTC
jgi:hypothetical protein